MYAPVDEYVPQCVPRERAARRASRLVWGALSLLTLAFLGLVVAEPLLLARGYVQAAAVIHRAFGVLCHQIPERSFHLDNHPLAVCARCTGIYAGFALSVLCYPLVRSLRRVETPGRLWLVLACVPMAIDVGLDYFGIWTNTHFSRLVTGAIFGAVCALFIVPGFLDLERQISEGRRAER
jgi:uncharacterized membrane protein